MKIVQVINCEGSDNVDEIDTAKENLSLPISTSVFPNTKSIVQVINCEGSDNPDAIDTQKENLSLPIPTSVFPNTNSESRWISLLPQYIIQFLISEYTTINQKC